MPEREREAPSKDYEDFLARNSRGGPEDEVDFADEHAQAGFTRPGDENAHPNATRRKLAGGAEGEQAGSVRESTLRGGGEN